MAQACEGLKGGALISAVHAFAQHGNPSSSATLRRILESARCHGCRELGNALCDALGRIILFASGLLFRLTTSNDPAGGWIGGGPRQGRRAPLSMISSEQNISSVRLL